MVVLLEPEHFPKRKRSHIDPSTNFGFNMLIFLGGCFALIFQFLIYLEPGVDRDLIYWLAWELGSKYIGNWKMKVDELLL